MPQPPRPEITHKDLAVFFAPLVLEAVLWYFVWHKVLRAPHLEEYKLFKALGASFTFLGAILLSHYALTNKALVAKLFPRLADWLLGFLCSGFTVAMCVGMFNESAGPNALTLQHFGFIGFMLVAHPLMRVWEDGFKRFCSEDLEKVRGFGFSLVVYGQAIQLWVALSDTVRP